MEIISHVRLLRFATNEIWYYQAVALVLFYFYRFSKEFPRHLYLHDKHDRYSKYADDSLVPKTAKSYYSISFYSFKALPFVQEVWSLVKRKKQHL